MVKFRINTITVPEKITIYNYAPSCPTVGDVTFINADSSITSYVQQIPLAPGASFGFQANQGEQFDGRLDIRVNANANLIIVEKVFI